LTRTLHTQPRSILAARRAGAPHRARGDEPLAAHRQRRLVSDLGVELREDDDGQWPRIRVGRCRPGFLHPIGRGEITELLTFLGPPARYGLRSIELRQSVGEEGGSLTLARLLVPGRIVLFEQMEPPWLIRGDLSHASRARLERAGAALEAGPAVTRVEWPGRSLADVMLFDGLMHEIGHHLIQHHTGKRLARVMRTADHERRAEQFAEACRQALVPRETPA
jgi:hypothetical protein